MVTIGTLFYQEFLDKTPPANKTNDGFFMTFLDPDRPDVFQISEFPDHGKFPCSESNSRLVTKCALRVKEGQREIIIPSYEMIKQRPCTAILNMETLKWKCLNNDGRGEDVTERVEANVIR